MVVIIFYCPFITDLWDVLVLFTQKENCEFQLCCEEALTLNGQLSWSTLLGAYHVLSDTLILPFIDRLHIIYQQIATIDNAQSIIQPSSNII